MCALSGFRLLLSKDQRLGKYQIIDRLGAGGFGTVYLAMDRLLDQKVALKVPNDQSEEALATIRLLLAGKEPPQQGSEARRFLLESKIMAKLKHDSIVSMIAVEDIDGLFFMVMEYVEGESLDRHIRRERGLKPQRALEIAIGVCGAIAYAHSEKVIHRDLRPPNILMTLDGKPKVTDFGVSRYLEEGCLSAPTRIGSPPYMAPEHFKGKTVFQSDIWSLGITIYEMLIGMVPFYDADPVKIAQAYATKSVVAPHLRSPAVPKAFSDVVMKAVAVNLGERYASAQEMLRALMGLREAPAASGYPAAPQVPPVLPKPAQNPTPSLCPFCYHPLPRLAKTCPTCGEKL